MITRRNAILVLTASYFTVWLIFGALYRREATNSDGQAFSFNEDVRVQAIATQFSVRMDGAIDKRLLCEIVRGAECCRFTVSIYNSANERVVYGLQPVGRQWAIFYAELLEHQGITHFTVEPLGVGEYPLTQLSPNIVVLPSATSESTLPIPESRPFSLTLFSGPLYQLPVPPGSPAPAIKGRHTVWLTKSPSAPKMAGKPISGFPIVRMQEVLQNSLVFLDDSPKILAAMVKGTRKYPLADFLYFSAVTITTLGFGDITPNDTRVRILVMIEAFLGLVIVGGLASVLFSWDPKTSKRHMGGKET